jgi:hypothetical protein
VHVNLWLLNGDARTDGRDVDVAIAGFRIVADCLFSDGFESAATCAEN